MLFYGFDPRLAHRLKDPEQVLQECEEFDEYLYDLTMRVKRQGDDITELQQELQRLKEDIKAQETETISSENGASA